MFSLNLAALAAAAAWADDIVDGAANAPSMLPNLLIFGGMFLFIYLVLFRPQQKKQREHMDMVSSLQKGDRIQTNGGLMGVITGVDPNQNELTVEIAPQVRVKVARGFVSRVVKASPPPSSDRERDSKPDKENRPDKDRDYRPDKNKDNRDQREYKDKK
jgi:preprotein translocase subunit YajC